MPRSYTPPVSTIAEWLALADALGIAYGVLVQASVTGFDNSVLLDAITAAPDRLRGIAVVPADVTAAELKRLHGLGIRGIRCNTRNLGGVSFEAAGDLARRVAPLGWSIQFLLRPEQLETLGDAHPGDAGPARRHRPLRSSPIQPSPASPNASSACSIPATATSSSPGPTASARDNTYAPVAPIASALVASHPERLIWGSDWPHTELWDNVPDDADLLDATETWLGSGSRARSRLLRDAPPPLLLRLKDRLRDRRPPALTGLWPPVTTPFADDGSVDFGKLVKHSQALLDEGATGLAILGTTSEANSLTLDERRRAIDAHVEAGIPAAKLMPGTGACAVDDVVALSRHAGDLGAAAVLLVPPFFYKGVSDDGVFAFMARVIEKAGAKVPRIMLYHIPPMAAVGWSIPLIARLREAFPGLIVGLKDSSGDKDNTKAIVEAFRDDFAVFPGAEVYLKEALDWGAKGCISATANVNARAIAKLLREQGRARRPRAAGRAQRRPHRDPVARPHPLDQGGPGAALPRRHLGQRPATAGSGVGRSQGRSQGRQGARRSGLGEADGASC